MNEPMGDTVLSDARDRAAVGPTMDVDGGVGSGAVPSNAGSPEPGEGMDGVVLAAEREGYRVRIIQPVEVSSTAETQVFTDRGAAIDKVLEVAHRLETLGFKAYKILVVAMDESVVWTLTKRGKVQ